MQHPHDLNAVRNGEIKNDVTAHGKAAQPIGQFLPPPPQLTLLCQQLKFLIEPINERIGLIGAVFGDELSDFRQNRQGAALENDHRHGLCVRSGSAA
jgi:hypothetical protein